MIKKPLKGYFFTGLFAILPIVLTIRIFMWFFNFSLSLVSESIVAKELEKIAHFLSKNSMVFIGWEGFFNVFIRLGSLILILVIITLLGYTLKHVFISSIINTVNKILEKMPLIRHIYITISQIIGLLSSDKAATYKKVVLIEYPRKGVYSIGFLTSECNQLISESLDKEEICNIFIPTSPNPTSGMFVMLPKSELVILDIKVDDAVKLIISGGAIVPTINRNGE